ncbi:hypothetical protein HK096_006634 [Nowakowskiella sp. JEL0078]|nr:hypothetical protein HK096_006634 [Nowakowskiella sp. JEL0078]
MSSGLICSGQLTISHTYFLELMKEFIIKFAQVHSEFRLAELDSLAILNDIPIEYDKSEYSEKVSFQLITSSHQNFLIETNYLLYLFFKVAFLQSTVTV